MAYKYSFGGIQISTSSSTGGVYLLVFTTAVGRSEASWMEGTNIVCIRHWLQLTKYERGSKFSCYLLLMEHFTKNCAMARNSRREPAFRSSRSNGASVRYLPWTRKPNGRGDSSSMRAVSSRYRDRAARDRFSECMNAKNQPSFGPTTRARQTLDVNSHELQIRA